MRSHARSTAAGLLVMVLAACSSSGPAAPKDHAQMVARLLSKSTAPSQVTVTDFHEPDTSAQPAPPPQPLDCSELIGVARVVGSDPDAVPVDSANVALAWHEPGQSVSLGTEFMYRYAPGGAKKTLADVRALVGRCPTYQDNSFGSVETDTFSLISAPALGDESLAVRAGSSSADEPGQTERDTVVVRSGDVLIAIDELPRLTSTPSHLDVELNAAWKAYTGG